jgi:adenosylcobyric acid synthase
MHMGRTEGVGRAWPFAQLADSGAEGAVSPDGRVTGTYIHGLFNTTTQRAAWLARFDAGAPRLDHEAAVEGALDALAAHLEAHLDIDALLRLAARGTAAPAGR